MTLKKKKRENELLTYDNAKKLLKKANQYIITQNN
jgi:DNA-directed RNA polymerase subunit F